ncbi:MAG: phosphoribosylformylglycinamidine synthase subunit PurS [Pedosphaera sp.]|nr:phosphoribosylformylglycinamidine synthase subunit PurS [Pedosphaera sp.]
MKAKIIITPKKAVLDPQGKTVQTALEHMGYNGIIGVHIGKYIEIDLAPGTDKAAAAKALNEAAHKLLSNPVIEDYKLEITEEAPSNMPNATEPRRPGRALDFDLD